TLPRSRPLVFLPVSFFVEAAMTPRIQKNLRQRPSPEPLRVTHRHAAGIDVHAAAHWVAVPPEDAPPPPANHPTNLPPNVRRFGTCTADLIALADWLAAIGCICAWLETDHWRAYRSAEARAPETACGSGAQIVASSARRRPLHSSASSKRTER